MRKELNVNSKEIQAYIGKLMHQIDQAIEDGAVTSGPGRITKLMEDIAACNRLLGSDAIEVRAKL